jgi:hypothetical protein
LSLYLCAYTHSTFNDLKKVDLQQNLGQLIE